MKIPKKKLLSIKVMIVDDDCFNILCLESILKSIAIPIQIIKAFDGMSAYNKFIESYEE